MGSTIVARATALGQSGIAITRISGSKSLGIAQQLFGRQHFEPRKATFVWWKENNQFIDQCIVIYFPGPRSATGEDVVEIHTHGNTVLTNMLIMKTQGLGASLAQPGEFMQRAFLNGKVDLVQAEAVADLIAASSEQELKSAAQSLSGVFSAQVHHIQQQLNDVRINIEALIDFSDEDISPNEQDQINRILADIKPLLSNLLGQARQGLKVRQGLVIAIVGPANAGKSSLLNILTQEESAIVTDIEGTTRDVIKERVYFNGVCLTLLDTAGLRLTENAVEKMGIEKTKDVIAKANHVLVLVDGSKFEAEGQAKGIIQEHGIESFTVIYNKKDLFTAERSGLCLSTKTKDGIDALETRLKQVANESAPEGDTFIARARHVEALESALSSIEQAEKQVVIEIQAQDLRQAQLQLDQILGVVSSDDLLGMIFSTFCIGK
ncbi:tRNA uridine-5-carboxymethylaminomethyl(34) synthesis GTPase MnmE [Gammaproteobacteria bacterium]|nr:tRNA uridine-5-carboxymethylaminomethyl(34) synthesis GTPase MnmE [Gammaproteobacteria bacterium]